VSAAGSERGARAFPRAPFLIPANPVHIALVTENTAENNVMFDALDLEATFGQVAAGFELGGFSHALAFLEVAAFLRSSSDEGAPFM
jgi:hypothetical protein